MAYPSRASQPDGERSPFGPEEMALTLACFFLAGAGLGYVSLLAPRAPEGDLALLLGTSTAALITGLVLLAVGRRLTVTAVSLFLALGTLAITSAGYFDGHAGTVYALLYLWVGVEAFCFLDRRQAVLQMVLMAAAYAWLLRVTEPDGIALQRWILTVGCTLAAGLLVAYLRHRIVGLLDRLHETARTDVLTGLLNRRAFEERFAEELDRARRDGRPLTVLIGDLDGFKLVNDRSGHQAGDRALRRLASELGTWRRRTDVAARVGGEEFALLLPGTAEAGGLELAERIRLAVREVFAGDEVPLTISFGIAGFPDRATDGPGVLRAADQALYAAKELGRDRCVVFSAELSASVREAGARVADSSEMQLATVVGLAEALDIRDTGTARHSRVVGRYAAMMASELALDNDRVHRIRLAGMLHDVGKIGISDRVLNKPGPLDDEDWIQMRTHPQIGARLLARPELADLRGWVLAHHERPDGQGYPFRLGADAIPLEARILAVADAYEAMTADRVYRSALGHQAAREELEAGAGTQFDGDVIQAFLAALDRAGDRRGDEAAGEVLAEDAP